VAIGTGAIYGQNLALVTDSWRPLLTGAFAGGVAADGAGQRSGLWVKGYGLFSHEGDGEAAPGFNATAGGIIAGAQWAAGNGVTAGAAFSYARVDATFTSAEGVEEVTQFKGAAYARYEGGGLFLRGLVGISSDSFQTARMADPQTVAQGRFSGTGGAGFAEAGRSFAFGPGVIVTPSLRLGYVGARVGGFDETGAQGLDLAVSGASLDAFASTAGVRFEKTFVLGETSQITGAVSLGWEHQFLQTAQTLDAAYAGGPETLIAGNVVSRDGAVVSVKVTGVASGKVHCFLGYDVKVAGTYSDQTASAGLKFIF
jgi:subtilase-type serine protease